MANLLHLDKDDLMARPGRFGDDALRFTTSGLLRLCEKLQACPSAAEARLKQGELWHG